MNSASTIRSVPPDSMRSSAPTSRPSKLASAENR